MQGVPMMDFGEHLAEAHEAALMAMAAATIDGDKPYRLQAERNERRVIAAFLERLSTPEAIEAVIADWKMPLSAERPLAVVVIATYMAALRGETDKG